MMTPTARFILSLLVAALTFGTAAAAEVRPQPLPVAPLQRTSPVDFETEILPAFRTSCLACHNRTTTKGGLILETPQTILKGGEDGPVVVPAKSADSSLFQLAAHLSKPVMPPRDNKASAPNLTPDQLALLRLWIDQGAKGEVHSESIHWQPIPGSFAPSYAVAVSPDGQYAATGRANRLHLYHLPTQRLLPPLSDPQLKAFAHRDMIYSLAFSPDGTRLASGSFGEVKIWRRAAPNVERSFAGAALASNGKWIVIAKDDGQLLLIDRSTGKPLKTLSGRPGSVRLARFSPDSARLLCATEKTAQIWKIETAAVTAELTAPAEIRSAVWTGAGKGVALGEADNVIRTYVFNDALSPGPELKGHAAPVTALDVLPNDQLVSGSADGTIRLWNLGSSQQVRQLGHGAPVTTLAVRPDEKAFASAGENGVIKIWDATKDAPLAELKGDPALTRLAAEREADQSLAAADVAFAKSILQKAEADQKAQQDRLKKATEARAVAEKAAGEKQAALDAATGARAEAERALAAAQAGRKRVAEVNRAADAARAGALSAVGKAALAKFEPTIKPLTDRLTAATAAQTTAENALKPAELSRANAVNESELAQAAVARATAAVAAAKESVVTSEERQAKATADAAGAKQAAADTAAKPIRALAFSPDGLTLASAGDEGHTHLWNTTDNSPHLTVDTPAAVRALAFVDNTALLATSTDGTTLWDISTRWTLERTIGTGDADSPLADRVNALAFDPGGRVLATGSGEPSRGGQVQLWDFANGQLLRECKDVHSDAVLCLAFSRDGRRLASGAADRFVKVLDAGTGRVLQSLEGHTHHVLGVSFKADGRMLASSGADGQVKFWDLVAGERKANVPPVPKELAAIQIMGVTDQAILTSADHQIRVVNSAGGAVRSFSGPADHIHTAALSPNGRTYITAGQSGALYLWDCVTGRPTATLTAPKAD